MSNKNSFRLVNKLTGARVMFLNFLFLGTFLLSCSKNEPDEISNIVVYPDTSILKDYNLSHKDVYYNDIEFDDSRKYLFCYTRVNNKIILEGFNVESKKQVLNCDSIHIDTVYTIDKGYGDIVKRRLGAYNIYDIIKIGNRFCFALGIEDITSFVVIIDDEKVKQYEGYWRVHRWYKDTFITSKYSESGYMPSSVPMVCLALDGTKLFDFIDKNGYIDYNYNSDEFVASMKEKVYFNRYGKTIRRVNIVTGETLWESEKILSDLPKNIRIDETTFKPIDDSFISLAFKYTFYDGTKGERKYKVDIKSGKLTLL